MSTDLRMSELWEISAPQELATRSIVLKCIEHDFEIV